MTVIEAMASSQNFILCQKWRVLSWDLIFLWQGHFLEAQLLSQRSERNIRVLGKERLC